MAEKWPLVYIRWVDIYDSSTGWHDIIDIDEWIDPEWIVDQVGWVYKEDEQYIILVNMIAYGAGQLCHVTKIPKSNVMYREEIVLGGKKRQKK